MGSQDSTASYGGTGGTVGRKWVINRNDPNWIFRFAMQPDYVGSQDWKSTFRIRYDLFMEVTQKIRPHVQSSVTRFRLPTVAEKKLGEFLMVASNATYRRVASLLGMGPSTVLESVRSVSKTICTLYSDKIQLPTSSGRISSIMQGFQDIAGLPRCVGAIDGSHIL